MLVNYLLRVSLQYLKRLFKRPDDFRKGSASLCDVLWLSKRVENTLILVDPLIQLSLEFLLGHTDQEVTNKFRDRLAHRANGDFEYSIDTSAHLLYEDIRAARHSGVLIHLVLLLLLLLRIIDRLAVLIILLWHLVFFRNNRSSVLLVVLVINEHIVLLRVNYGLNQLTGMITLTLKALADDIHDLRSERWAAHEDSLHN